ncbi:hypothetical protein J4732_21275 [Serratia marcescens]|uniref:Uncharacterized protein n=1 Tax=Serratia marcescens TaxID=615 RepID=A0A939NQY6_SERMA|nr:hypothetical protein [Serratia marcescens]
MEDEAGNAASVTGEDFAARLGALERIPSLVVLCSAKAPVPAIPHATRWSRRPHVSQRGRAGGIGDAGQAFDVCGNAIYPGVFRQLAEHGESRSRYRQCAGKIMDSPDWWIPVVFTRLNNARIWYPRIQYRRR